MRQTFVVPGPNKNIIISRMKIIEKGKLLTNCY